MADPWPLRLRLYGGRVTHAARQLTTSDSHETGCDYYLDVDAVNHWQPDDTDITCRKCIRRITHPRIGDPRRRTPNVVTTQPDGLKSTRMTIKRCCNGCDSELGDADNRDVTRSGHLTDVRVECPTCTPAKEG